MEQSYVRTIETSWLELGCSPSMSEQVREYLEREGYGRVNSLDVKIGDTDITVMTNRSGPCITIYDETCDVGVAGAHDFRIRRRIDLGSTLSNSGKTDVAVAELLSLSAGLFQEKGE